MTGTVGLVVNPGAARDVRRLTSLARTVDVHERINAVARVLAGLAAARVERVLFMPEPSAIVSRALDLLAAIGAPTPAGGPPRVAPVHLPGEGLARDAAGTAAAASAMAEEGVDCVVTFGGDGTNRAVAAGWPGGLLVPLPGGTNNAFAVRAEPTAAGLAAGLFAAEPDAFPGLTRQAPSLEVHADGATPWAALVDVALVRGPWIGTHALWDPALLIEAVVTCPDPAASGLAGVAGMAPPAVGGDAVPSDRAVHLVFGEGGVEVLAPLGPGQLERVAIRSRRPLAVGEVVRSVPGAATVAFDGEREISLLPGTPVEVRPVPRGPHVLDVDGILRAAAVRGDLVDRAPVPRR